MCLIEETYAKNSKKDELRKIQSKLFLFSQRNKVITTMLLTKKKKKKKNRSLKYNKTGKDLKLITTKPTKIEKSEGKIFFFFF